MVEIPWKSLEETTLRRLIEEIVTRDGTDYGASEIAVETRIAQALNQLVKGSARLVWDEDSASASLVSTEFRV